MSRSWHIRGKHSYHSRKIIIIYALVISVIWHFGWAILFKVDLKKKDLWSLTSTDTVFLGNFLNKSLLTENLSSYTYCKRRDSDKAISFLESFSSANKILPKKVYSNEKKDFNLLAEKITGKKLAESLLLKTVSLKGIFYSKKKLNLSGPLGGRAVLYIPNKPDIPPWLKDQGLYYIKYKMFVDREGRVIFLEQLSSSGDTEVDFLAEKYLGNVIFSDIRGQRSLEDYQWGIVSLSLGAEDVRS